MEQKQIITLGLAGALAYLLLSKKQDDSNSEVIGGGGSFSYAYSPIVDSFNTYATENISAPSYDYTKKEVVILGGETGAYDFPQAPSVDKASTKKELSLAPAGESGYSTEIEQLYSRGGTALTGTPTSSSSSHSGSSTLPAINVSAPSGTPVSSTKKEIASAPPTVISEYKAPTIQQSIGNIYYKTAIPNIIAGLTSSIKFLFGRKR